MPKEEAPRPDPSWSVGRLEDLVWHAYERWWIATESFGAMDGEGTLYLYGPGTLVIQPFDYPRRVYAPDAHICDNTSLI
jgi:hypothetical protein